MSALGQPIRLAGPGATLWRSAWRYGLTSLGPVAVSGAHFVASLLFLRLLPPAAFGHFSFLMIVVPFALSATGALLGAPAAQTRGKDAASAEAELNTLLNISLLVSLLALVAVAALMAATGAGTGVSLAFGGYAAVFTARSFARSYANVMGTIVRVAVSDILYSLVLIAALAGLAAVGAFSLTSAAVALAIAAVLALPAFGRGYFARLLAAVAAPRLRAYRPMWLAVTRWSLLGVGLTELAANCHAYLVTFICGPGAFGLLALGALFMRPASLVLGALPDIDQPVMARKIAAGDIKGAFGVVNEFRTAAGAVLAGTIGLALILVLWFPHLLLKNYRVDDVLVVLAFWSAITLLRTLRTPEAVFLMASGDYPRLAWISGVSSVVALLLTLLLLVAAGPLWSLGGVLAGEAVMTVMLFALTNRWRRCLG